MFYQAPAFKITVLFQNLLLSSMLLFSGFWFGFLNWFQPLVLIFFGLDCIKKHVQVPYLGSTFILNYCCYETILRSEFKVEVSCVLCPGANVNRATANKDHTVVSLACAGGHLAVVELLLTHGADPTHRLKVENAHCHQTPSNS